MARCKFDALNLLVEDGGSNLCVGGGAGRAEGAKMKSIPVEGAESPKGPQTWWTRLRPIRTVAMVELDFAISSSLP
jgi:hypothetical protein